MDQPRLPLEPSDDRAPETLIVSAANRPAWEALLNWRAWPGGAFALAGPEGAGKSHMAQAWAIVAGAAAADPMAQGARIRSAFEAADGRLVFDGLERGCDDAALSLALDLARDRGGAVLLVGRGRPRDWPTATPDLATRFAATPCAMLDEPDLELLQKVLRRLARARFIELPEAVARYMAESMERSFAAAQAATDALDRNLVRGARPVTYDVARRAIGQIAPAPEDPAS